VLDLPPFAVDVLEDIEDGALAFALPLPLVAEVVQDVEDGLGITRGVDRAVVRAVGRPDL